ncbi:MAG: HNH endonuclease [Blastocatellia bacterium]
MPRQSWSRDELLVTFNLYCRTPFGRLHRSNPEIISLARKIGRTPSAVAMKLVNFASFDPIHQARSVRGLNNASQADRHIWDEFNANPEQLAFESQKAFNEIVESVTESDKIVFPSSGQTETTRIVRVRLVQRFFRESVLTSYNYRCSICELSLVELLTASHIIPWSRNVERRADPRNGLALCAIHDRAFDRGLITLDDSFRVLLSRTAKIITSSRLHLVALMEIEGNMISMPKRFSPDPIALAYHRTEIFRQ